MSEDICDAKRAVKCSRDTSHFVMVHKLQSWRLLGGVNVIECKRNSLPKTVANALL